MHKTIPKIDMYAWLIAHGSILMEDNLKKSGFQAPSQCALCHVEEETINHLLLECVFAKEVWREDLRNWDQKVALPSQISCLFAN